MYDISRYDRFKNSEHENKKATTDGGALTAVSISDKQLKAVVVDEDEDNVGSVLDTDIGQIKAAGAANTDAV